ncbi:MAG: hypothetical protein ACREL7_01250 [Longimicrobiales bacterium]
MTSLELRPRLATEIVDAAFQLYRRHFAELVSLSALAFVPYIVVQLLLTGGDPVEPTVAGAMTASVVLVFGWVIGSIMEAAVVVGVSNSYLHGKPDVPEALRRTFARLGAVLFSVSAKWFLIALGFMAAIMVGGFTSALIAVGAGTAGAGAGLLAAILMIGVFAIAIPVGLFFFASFFAVPATVILEGVGVGAGLRRSRVLSRGIRRRILGALGIPMLLFMVFQLTVAGIAQFLPGPRLVGFLAEQVVTIIAYPIIAVIATLLYYDARIRKEGFDIERMAAELEPSRDPLYAHPSASPPA